MSHTSRTRSLEDIADCVEQLMRESAGVTESATHAKEPLQKKLSGV